MCWSGAAWDLPDELDLYLTLNLSRAVRLHAAKDVVDQGLVKPSALVGVPALVSENSIAYRTGRENEESGGFESGVIAHGPQAEALADQYAQLLRHWAEHHRRRGAATFRYLPGPAPSPFPRTPCYGGTGSSPRPGPETPGPARAPGSGTFPTTSRRHA